MEELYFIGTLFSSFQQSAIKNEKSLNLFVDSCSFCRCISDAGSAIFNMHGDLFVIKTCIYECKASSTCPSIFTEFAYNSISQITICYCSPEKDILDDIFASESFSNILITQSNISNNLAIQLNSAIAQIRSTNLAALSFLVLDNNTCLRTFELNQVTPGSSMTFIIFKDNLCKETLLFFYSNSTMSCSSLLIIGTKSANYIISDIDKNKVLFSDCYYDGNIHSKNGPIPGLMNKVKEIPEMRVGVKANNCDGFFRIKIRSYRNMLHNSGSILYLSAAFYQTEARC